MSRSTSSPGSSCRHGTVRIREEHAAQPGGGARPAGLGPSPSAASASTLPDPAEFRARGRRLRVPVPLPDLHVECGRERAGADVRPRTVAFGTGGARTTSCAGGRRAPSGQLADHCPAESASASPSPGRSPTGRAPAGGRADGGARLATGEQIIALLQRLREERHMTILLVTNDEAVAGAADRTLRSATAKSRTARRTTVCARVHSPLECLNRPLRLRARPGRSRRSGRRRARRRDPRRRHRR